MMHPQIKIDRDNILISGELTFGTVAALLAASHKLFPSRAAWNCDLSQISHCDSAGLALLIEWVKLAQQQKAKLQFFHLPPPLQKLATATGLTTFLPVG